LQCDYFWLLYYFSSKIQWLLFGISGVVYVTNVWPVLETVNDTAIQIYKNVSGWKEIVDQIVFKFSKVNLNKN
jgi:hypothetical protein